MHYLKYWHNLCIHQMSKNITLYKKYSSAPDNNQKEKHKMHYNDESVRRYSYKQFKIIYNIKIIKKKMFYRVCNLR